jgi:hypothetical protein
LPNQPVVVRGIQYFKVRLLEVIAAG